MFGQKWLYSGKMVLFGKYGCNQACLLYSEKVFVFLQKLLYSGKSGCIRSKVVVLGQSGCTWAKVVVFLQKLLYSGKDVFFLGKSG